MTTIPQLAPNGSTLREFAHSYIDRGWPVLLLGTDGSTGKKPTGNCPECKHDSPSYIQHLAKDCTHLLCHGFYAATLDKVRFDQMMERLPGGHLAIRTGQAARLLVIDAEAHARVVGGLSGLDELDQWENATGGLAGSLVETLRSRSVSGGIHLYYRLPVGVMISSKKILSSVDVKCESGYVGAPSGIGNREWLNPDHEVVDAPSELVNWLSTIKVKGDGGSDSVGPSDGYDFNTFLKNGCPNGHREYFFNDLAFRLRKKGLDRNEYEQAIWEAWTACEQPEWNYMAWEDVQGKQERVWNTVTPAPTHGAGIAWAKKIVAEAKERFEDLDISDEGISTGKGEGGDDDDGNVQPPVSIGTLNPDHWYGANDDGTAARMFDVWGDMFRAIPKDRGGYAWLWYDGITWQPDNHGRIWSAMRHVVDQLPDEVNAWQLRCEELASEGVEDWRTAVVGGNGQNAGEFNIMVQLRKYQAACKENARKENGVRAFARLDAIAVAEDDMDATTRYVGLPDGRVLDVGAVHGGSDKKDWVLLGRPEMLITKKLGCDHVRPGAGKMYHGSNFKRYLEDVLPDEDVRESLQEIVGYALLGEPEEKIIVLLHGPPDSGKTVLLEIMEAMFGDYSGWTDGQALIAGKAKSAHTEWLNNIRGLRLVVTPETARGAKIDAAWMKSYTGREPQSSRGVYGDRTFTWKPTGIIFNASNHYVEYDAEDTAVAERTQVIEFEEQFLRGDPRRDDKLPSKIIEDELPILLNWALEGLRRHGERKRLDSSAGLDIAAKIVEWSRKYHTAQDHVGQFIADAIEEKKITPADDVAAGGCVPLKTVYALYRSWCKAQELKKPLGRNSFNSHLRQVYHWNSYMSMGMRWLGYTAPYKDEADIMLVSW